jgi:hypothetical protein
MLHCCNEFARKEDMLVEINAGFGMRVWNGKSKYPDRCYLQVTGIYSFPDHLSGRIWADLELSTGDLEKRKNSTRQTK